MARLSFESGGSLQDPIDKNSPRSCWPLVFCRVLKHHMPTFILTTFTSKRNGGVSNKKVGWMYQEKQGDQSPVGPRPTKLQNNGTTTA